MNFAEPIERPKLLTELAVDRIRSAIVVGRLQFGQALSESALAGMLGMSKTPVREALLRLRHEGLVEIHPQRGTFVFQPTEDEVTHICQFRAVIECEALADAARHRHAALLDAMATSVARLTEAVTTGDSQAFPALDTEFHDLIVANSENAYLRTAYRLIAAQVAAMRHRLPAEDDQIGHCQEEHGCVLDSVRAGDIRKAQSLLRAHIQSTRRSYLALCRAQLPAAPEPLLRTGT